MRVGEHVRLTEQGLARVDLAARALSSLAGAGVVYPRILQDEVGVLVKEEGANLFHCQFQYCTILVTPRMVCSNAIPEDDPVEMAEANLRAQGIPT